jgi:hypothetical protein
MMVHPRYFFRGHRAHLGEVLLRFAMEGNIARPLIVLSESPGPVPGIVRLVALPAYCRVRIPRPCAGDRSAGRYYATLPA